MVAAGVGCMSFAGMACPTLHGEGKRDAGHMRKKETMLATWAVRGYSMGDCWCRIGRRAGG